MYSAEFKYEPCNTQVRHPGRYGMTSVATILVFLCSYVFPNYCSGTARKIRILICSHSIQVIFHTKKKEDKRDGETRGGLGLPELQADDIWVQTGMPQMRCEEPQPTRTQETRGRLAVSQLLRACVRLAKGVPPLWHHQPQLRPTTSPSFEKRRRKRYVGHELSVRFTLFGGGRGVALVLPTGNGTHITMTYFCSLGEKTKVRSHTLKPQHSSSCIGTHHTGGCYQYGQV